MTQRILILGIDGYIGYPLAQHLLNKGHEVYGLDNYLRRKLVKGIGSKSLTPIQKKQKRESYLRDIGLGDDIARADMADYYTINKILKEYKPTTIVHLAEQPSAPWSMRSVRQAWETQCDNVLGTLSLLWAMREHCPSAHLVKLGSMGEYGTPDCDIPEGEIPEECLAWPELSVELTLPLRSPECPMSGLPFPRSPNSWYHLSKVHDTHNIIFACKTWGMRSTDIMQGVVYGLHNYESNELQVTRFDYDQYFGTAVNRFCAQALSNTPLTVYGLGTQERGFLTLSDSIKCLTLAIDNPPSIGDYRTFNQFEQTYMIKYLAELVHSAAKEIGLNSEIMHIENPRTEDIRHYYRPAHNHLFDLGYKPDYNTEEEIKKLLMYLYPYRDRINKDVILPTTTWR